MKKLKGKVAIISGGSGGAGTEISKLYAAEGAKVIIAARGEKAAQTLVDDIRANGGEAVFVKTDVTSEEQIKACVDMCLEKYGTIWSSLS